MRWARRVFCVQADRLLQLGFQEEVAELVRACPAGRQTLLFSATMNTRVDDLARLALNRVGRREAFVCLSVGVFAAFILPDPSPVIGFSGQAYGVVP